MGVFYINFFRPSASRRPALRQHVERELTYVVAGLQQHIDRCRRIDDLANLAQADALQGKEVAFRDYALQTPAFIDSQDVAHPVHGHGERGVGSLLIEGGGRVAASFLQAGVVDAIEWFRAPILLGGEGRPCVASLALAKLADAPKFRRLGVEPVGDDLWERYARA